jgi:predicted dehydrogenase
MSITRRSFVQASAATLGSTALVPNLFAAPPTRREKIRIAVVGFNGRGKELINAIRSCDKLKLVALCDVDSKILAGFEPGNSDLFRTEDLDELLQRDDIDAIASATPNHWHTLVTMKACAAGKHVYIEKPISHNMYESRMVVASARKYDRIVQCGFQNRSDSALLPFYERLHSGEFGKVLSVHGTCHRARDPIGKLETALRIPENIDYDRWLGPAADEPIMRPRLHYDWHWDFNTGNGDVGNQGPHEWDLINWALGNPATLPTTMIAAGNRFGWDDAGNTPNVMACLGTHEGIPFSFEVMDLKKGGEAPRRVGVGVLIETESGMFAGGRGGGTFEFSDGRKEKFSRDPSQSGGDGLNSHMANFAEAILAGDRNLLRCESAIAANSSAMAHMANIAFRLGEQAETDVVTSAFATTPRSKEMIGRLIQAPENFGAENGGANVDQPWLLGQQLTFDNAARNFTGTNAESANQLMTRQYRAGYELPTVA